MYLRIFFNLLKNGKLILLLSLLGLFKPFYKLCYIASAKTNGLLELLYSKPLSLTQLAKAYCQSDNTIGALEAWLQLGIRLGLLRLGKQGYSLTGLGKKLSSKDNDDLLALSQEVAVLHYNLICKTPERIKIGSLWRLEEQHGELVARSSRSLEPFQTAAIDMTFPSSGAIRLLEVGCGSAFYIYYAARKNPLLTAIGIELQPEVGNIAQQNINTWGIQDRVKIEIGDIRGKEPVELFDIVTLYNNIYYFPFDERPSFLRHVRKFLKPSGLMLLTTGCQGGNLGIELLNLYGASTVGCGRLASVKEMVNQLHEAGYKDIKAINLIPGDKFYGFKASN
jgi:SAM-dependent methyltransferase